MSKGSRFVRAREVEANNAKLDLVTAMIQTLTDEVAALRRQVSQQGTTLNCCHRQLHSLTLPLILGEEEKEEPLDPFAELMRSARPRNNENDPAGDLRNIDDLFKRAFGINDLKKNGGNTGKKPGNGADRGASASDDPMLGILEKLMRGPNGKGGVFTAIGEDGSVFQGETLAEVLNKIEETLTKQGDEDSDPLGGTPFNYETSGGM